MVRRQTIEIKSVSLQQSLSKLKQRGVDLVKDSTGLEAGLDCRPGRFAAAQGRQSHPASRPVSSLTRSTPLCFSLARLVLRSPFLFYGLSPDHKKVIFDQSKALISSAEISRLDIPVFDVFGILSPRITMKFCITRRCKASRFAACLFKRS